MMATVTVGIGISPDPLPFIPFQTQPSLP